MIHTQIYQSHDWINKLFSSLHHSSFVVQFICSSSCHLPSTHICRLTVLFPVMFPRGILSDVHDPECLWARKQPDLLLTKTFDLYREVGVGGEQKRDFRAGETKKILINNAVKEQGYYEHWREKSTTLWAVSMIRTHVYGERDSDETHLEDLWWSRPSQVWRRKFWHQTQNKPVLK